MIRHTAVAIAIFATALSAEAAARVSFVRTVPAAHDLGGESAALIYAIGDSHHVEVFVDGFVEHVNRSGAIRMEALRDRNRHFVGTEPNGASWTRMRNEHAAEAYVGVNRFTCEMTERSAVGSTRDNGGERVKVMQKWADALCRATVEILDRETAKRVVSFEVKGEGTSPRVASVTDEERKIAIDQAARYAAIAAAEAVTPRRLRESIELDPRGASYDEGVALISGSQLAAARERWERDLKGGRGSAPLHYNVAAVCEALGDADSAALHYEEAQRLAPDDRLYRTELRRFRRRQAR